MRPRISSLLAKFSMTRNAAGFADSTGSGSIPLPFTEIQNTMGYTADDCFQKLVAGL